MALFFFRAVCHSISSCVHTLNTVSVGRASVFPLNKRMCNLFAVCFLAPAPNRLSDYKIWLFFDSLLSTRWLNFDFPLVLAAVFFCGRLFSLAWVFSWSALSFTNFIINFTRWIQRAAESTHVEYVFIYFIFYCDFVFAEHFAQPAWLFKCTSARFEMVSLICRTNLTRALWSRSAFFV